MKAQAQTYDDNGWLDRTAARFEELTWTMKVAALWAYGLVWMAIYQLAA